MENNQIELISQAYKLGEKSIIDFRKLFIPAEEDVECAWFHKVWDDILLNSKEHFAVEAFRESAKTSIVIRGHLLHRFVYPKKDCDYILIIKTNQTEACKKIKEISSEYLSNPWLRSNLVSIVEDTQKAFEARVKDIDGNIISVRIEGYGKGSSIRGLSWGNRRPSLICLDDCQDTEDSQSDIIQENDFQWFMSDVLFLGKKSRIFMIGNNLGEKCLIERIMSAKDELGFKTMKIPILNSNEESNWDTYWTTEQIIEEREKHRKLGTISIWFREKMCIAVAPEKQLFKKEYFKYYNPVDVDVSQLSVYTTVDLAISEKETADYTVVLTIGVNKENHWMILDCQYGRWNPSQTIDKIFEAVLLWKPLFVGVEKVAYQSAMRHFLEKEMPKRNVFFTVKDLLAEKKKELRIGALQPRFVTGTIWFPKNKSFLAEMEMQFLTFPKGLHDDIPDCLGYMEQIALPPVGGWGAVSDDQIPFVGSI